MTTKVRIGTCGFGLAKVEYARSFSCVEVQNTFYQPPQIATLERWRQKTPSSFEFTLKAWQLITHEARSPTYRRLKKNLSEIEKQEAGLFKPTPIVREAWEVTRACAEALKARTILFQCPASFTQTKENISNLEKFFSSITRGKFDFCWEPRGPWDKDVIKSICSDLKLSHVVDPFVAKTVTPRKSYFRLHGRAGWRYQYEEDELLELAAMLPQRSSSYVFFNNASMTRDALRFQAIVAEGGA
jgi:uncharacterized protein YecE (DUF72 family)